MHSPFPGMDPYLENPRRWPDVHHRIITEIGDQLQSRLVPRYIAQITPYVAMEQIEITAPRRSRIPDIGIYEHDPLHEAPGAVAIDAAPLTGTAVMEVATRYARIEIRAREEDTLVTAIELLSPANKRPGAEGADAYEQKRQELFQSRVHLLEIDVLRDGQRPLLTRPDILPPAPYFVFLSRAERWPEIDIWPVALRSPLPVVPVPLRAPDPDVPLHLTQVVQQVYQRARYDVQVDYQADPPPPALSPDEAAWLDARLHEAGVREQR